MRKNPDNKTVLLLRKALSGINLRLLLLGQMLFYVTFFGAPASAYSSRVLSQQDQLKGVRTYYPKHLNNLRRAVKPRVIRYIDSRNYRRYGKLQVKGVLFTYKNPRAKEVALVTSFDKYSHRPMLRNSRGVWYTIFIPPRFQARQYRKKIKYKFLVDGLYQYDSTHENYEEDMANSFISTYHLTDDDVQPEKGVIVLQEPGSYGQRVIFRIYAPEARNVSLLSNFNSFNAELDAMTKTSQGYFKLEKTLPPGEYIYMFRVDGTVQVDPANNDLRYHKVYGKASYLNIEQ